MRAQSLDMLVVISPAQGCADYLLLRGRCHPAQPWAGDDDKHISKALRDSIQYALDHRDEALAYAMQFARDVDPQLADKFVGMYVN